MRILMVNKFLYPKGGAETYFLKIGEFLEKQGHRVEYFGMYSEKNAVKNSLNLYTKEMDFHSSKFSRFFYPFKIIYSFEARRKIKKIIKQFKPDVIHLNNINFQITPSIIDVAYKNKIPIVQTVHDYQMICPNHLLYNENGICEKCIHGKKTNCIKYKCIHGSKAKSIIGAIEATVYTKILKTYKKISFYICPSSFLKEKLIEANQMYKKKTVVIHNYIELKELNNYQKEDYILFLGRLSKEKGLDIFLNTCMQLQNIKFKIAGTGPLENLCHGIDNVEFVGFKTGQELEELIAKAKFLVYPSVCYENCPLSILEAQSLGTPVITAAYGGMKELVEDNKTGILVNKINEENLQKTILDLYNNNEQINEMSKICIEKRNEMISLEQYCNQILEIYKNVINTNI